MSKYPEHDRLDKVKDESQAIGEFLDHMAEEGKVISEYVRQGDVDPDALFPNHEFLRPDHIGIQDRLAAYFGIDQDRIEAEKRAMLDDLRETSPAQ